MYRSDPCASQALFAELCRRLGVGPDRHGEAHVRCPFCGKEPARGQVHFSFSERGGKCFVCGQGAGLRRLARLWGGEGGYPAFAEPPSTPARVLARRERSADTDWAVLVEQYAAHPRRVDAWQAYKPLPEPVIRAHGLGLGSFPAWVSRCRHERLMVPLYERGKVVGIRARAIGCGCGKWLSPRGSKCVLYNAEALQDAVGKCVMILENPIDALLAQLALPDVIGVGTLGVSMWQEEWTAQLVVAHPAFVLVAFDNDRPGNGGGPRGRQEWLANHGRDIVPGGVRLVNRLLAAGLRARLYQWPAGAALHADVGGLLTQLAKERVGQCGALGMASGTGTASPAGLDLAS